MIKDNIENNIKRYERLLEKLPKQRLGFMLKDYYYENLKHCIRPSTTHQVSIAEFGFGVHPHDTGVGVVCNILLPEEPYTYNIIQGTYWYNEGQYGFNKFKREYGSWDRRLEEVIEELRHELKVHYQSKIFQQEKELEKLKEDNNSLKTKVESMFI